MSPLTFLDLTWTLISLVGVVALGYLTREAMLDRYAVREQVTLNGRRGIYAAMYLRHMLVFLFLQAVNTVIGVGALLAPEPVEPHNIRLASAVAAVCFDLAMDAVAVLDVFDRRRIRHYAGPTDRT